MKDKKLYYYHTNPPKNIIKVNKVNKLKKVNKYNKITMIYLKIYFKMTLNWISMMQNDNF